MKKERKPNIQITSYKARIYPSEYQAHWINQSIGNRRFIYNNLLSIVKEEPKKTMSYIGQKTVVGDDGKKKRERVPKDVRISSREGLQNLLQVIIGENIFLSHSHSQSNQESAHALANAFSNYFDPKMKKFGEPSFKKKRDGGKFYLPCQNENIEILQNKIKIKPLTTFIKKRYKDELAKNDNTLFEINFKPNGSTLPKDYEIKGVTIERNNLGFYYASFVLQYEENIEMKSQYIDDVKATGIDLGIANQIIQSNGETNDLSNKYKDYEKQKAELQKKLSKKIESKKEIILRKRKNPTIPSSKLKHLKKVRENDKFKTKINDRITRKEINRDNSFSKDEWSEIYDSNNIKKIQHKINSLSKKISNIRKDHNHKLSNILIKDNSIVIFEDLNIQGMVRNKKLSKSILDKGWGQLKLFTKYKAEKQGKIFCEIGRFFPSTKLCSTYKCGYKYQDITLKEREWTCPNCKTHHKSRDVNASINILREGLTSLGYLEYEIENYIKKVKNQTTLTRDCTGNLVEAKRHSA